MRPTYLAFVLSLSVASSTSVAFGDKSPNSNNKGRIEGTKWASAEFTFKGLKTSEGGIIIEFTNDGKLVYGVEGEDHTGAYSLGENDAVTFKFDQEFMAKKVHEETITIKDGRLILKDNSGPPFTFVKAKPSTNKGKIEGTKWSNVERTVGARKMPANTFKFEFKKDGKLIFKVMNQDVTGKYLFGHGDDVILKLDRELIGIKLIRQKTIIKDGKLTMVDSDGSSMVFTKEKED